jgi:hypothetical protein
MPAPAHPRPGATPARPLSDNRIVDLDHRHLSPQRLGQGRALRYQMTRHRARHCIPTLWLQLQAKWHLFVRAHAPQSKVLSTMKNGLIRTFDTAGEVISWRIALIAPEGDRLVLHLEPLRRAVSCPMCGTWSQRVHSRYRRRPWDVPWGCWPVQLVVHARRFFCDAPTCPRRNSSLGTRDIKRTWEERTAGEPRPQGAPPSIKRSPVAHLWRCSD